MNTLMLILSILWVIVFVVYTNYIYNKDKQYKNKQQKVLATIVAPVIILFFALYTSAAWVVGFRTRSAVINDPEMLLDASQRLQEIEEEKALQASRDAVKNIKEDDSKYAPIIGNADGKVVIYEFYDYNCGYCKRGNAVLSEVLASENDVKVVLKSFPIFPVSQIPGRAIVAAANQDATKVAEFHKALFENSLVPEVDEKTTEKDMNDKIKAIVLGLAKKAGLDVVQLEKDMSSPAVEEEILRTRQLAEKLGIQGTPAFVVGDQLFRGYIDETQMKTAIEKSK
ncbi:DsbA family protein [bacterium]|nr:DsbA family protein [bacterium]